MQKDYRHVFSELQKIFSEIIEHEIIKSLIDLGESNVKLANCRGDLILFDKYVVSREKNFGNMLVFHKNDSLSFSFSDKGKHCTYEIHLSANQEKNDRSYFLIRSQNAKYSKEQLFYDECCNDLSFKKCVIRMIHDMDPHRVEEVKQLLLA